MERKTDTVVLSPDRERRQHLVNLLQLDAVPARGTASPVIAAYAARTGRQLLIDAAALGDFRPEGARTSVEEGYAHAFGKGSVALDFTDVMLLTPRNLPSEQHTLLTRLTGREPVLYRGPDDYLYRETALSALSPVRPLSFF